MQLVCPANEGELAEAMRDASGRDKTIQLQGNNSKRWMGGPILTSDITISAAKLNQVIDYQSKDLTITVESGVPFASVQEMLSKQSQRLALDPPEWKDATIGGIVASDSSGPHRRGFGTLRDLIIGMRFVRVNGQFVRSGGKVVKNVAGLDMAKLLIGSFGTLAAISSVSFRVHPLPEGTATFLYASSTIDQILEIRNKLQRTSLKPVALDLLSPVVSARMDLRGFVLALRAEGSDAVLKRYRRELPQFASLTGNGEQAFWNRIQNFTPDFLIRQSCGVVVRLQTQAAASAAVFTNVDDPVLLRVGSGAAYAYLSSWSSAQRLLNTAAAQRWPATIEYAGPEIRAKQKGWDTAAKLADFPGWALMQRVKQVFDPASLLNESRMYGRI